MRYGIHEWHCRHGDCARALEPVRDRMRGRRWRRRYAATWRRHRMLAIRQAQRLGVQRPVVRMPWEPGPYAVCLETLDYATICVKSATATTDAVFVRYRFCGSHFDDGSACLFCEPGTTCHLHEVPF